MSVAVYNSGRSRLSTLAALAWPAIMEQILATMVSYVDTAMVGSLGADATAAVGINAPMTWLLNGIMQGVGVGYSVMVAHAIGAGDLARARKVLVQSLLALAACGLGIFAVLLALSGQIPAWLGAEADVLPNAVAYLRIYTLSIPFGASLMVLSAILRCMGNTRLPLLMNTAANLLNIFLNFLLIYPTRSIGGVTVWGAGMGVAGAAVATSISIAVAGSVLFATLFFRRDGFRLSFHEDWRPDRPLIRQAMKLGLPYIAERCAINVGQLATTWIIGQIGTVAMAANHIAVTAEGLCYLPAYGICYAATTLVGQSVGAGDTEGARKYGALSGWCGFGLCALTGAALFVFAPQLASLFNKDAVVIAEAARALRVVAPAEPMFATFIVLAGALRGAGDTRFPMFLCLGSMWGVRIVLAPILVFRFGVGLVGVWAAMAVDLVVRGVGCALRWRSGRWVGNSTVKEGS